MNFETIASVLSNLSKRKQVLWKYSNPLIQVLQKIKKKHRISHNQNNKKENIFWALSLFCMRKKNYHKKKIYAIINKDITTVEDRFITLKTKKSCRVIVSIMQKGAMS